MAGKASVGILIPARFTDDLTLGRPAQVALLIHCSNTAVASQAMAAANGIALRMIIDLYLTAGRSDSGC